MKKKLSINKMSGEPSQLKSEEIMEQKALPGLPGVSGGAVKTTAASDSPKITTAVKPPKPKDPRSVAMGKRLTELSRQARERKKQEAEFAEKNLEKVKQKLFFLFLVWLVILWVVFFISDTEKQKRKKNL